MELTGPVQSYSCAGASDSFPSGSGLREWGFLKSHAAYVKDQLTQHPPKVAPADFQEMQAKMQLAVNERLSQSQGISEGMKAVEDMTQAEIDEENAKR